MRKRYERAKKQLKKVIEEGGYIYDYYNLDFSIVIDEKEAAPKEGISISGRGDAGNTGFPIAKNQMLDICEFEIDSFFDVLVIFFIDRLMHLCYNSYKT